MTAWVRFNSIWIFLLICYAKLLTARISILSVIPLILAAMTWLFRRERGGAGAAQRVGKYPGSWSLHLVGHMQIRIGKSLAHSPNAPGGNPLVIL